MFSLILGLIFGNIVYDVINNLYDADSDTCYWIIIVLFIIFFIYLKTKLEDHVIIIVTSLLGSYMVVRAFTIFKPEFPDEGYIAALYHHKEVNTISRVINQNMMSYILAFVVLFIIGLIVQISNYEKEEKNGDKEEGKDKEDDKKEAENKKDEEKLEKNEEKPNNDENKENNDNDKKEE